MPATSQPSHHPGGPAPVGTPQAASFPGPGGEPSAAGSAPTPVLPGVEVLIREQLHLLRGRRVGLITNQAGVDRLLRSTIDLLLEAGVQLVALFGPEHGVRGDAQAGVPVGDERDPRTGLPVYSLYGATKKPTAQMLRDVEVLVCDLQDAGCRYWTNLYTMAYAMEAAAEHGVGFVVLDRPNPIGGQWVEGNLLDPAYRSFVGGYPLVIRHGLTMGEAARYLAGELGVGKDPIVVPAKGWRRWQFFSDTGLPWVPPSPNSPTPDTLTLYPGTCLVEGTNLSEGRGTTRPFELIGAPWLDAHRLADQLNALNLPGVRFRPAYFTPTFSKHQGERCAGVQIHILDRRSLPAVEVGVHLLAAARAQDPQRFAWRPPGGGGRPFIDLLAGGDGLRRHLDQGAPAEELLAAWRQDAAAFAARRRPYLLYPD